MRISEGSFLEEMSFEQHLENVRTYGFVGTRQGCDDLLELTSNWMSKSYVSPNKHIRITNKLTVEELRNYVVSWASDWWKNSLSSLLAWCLNATTMQLFLFLYVALHSSLNVYILCCRDHSVCSILYFAFLI